MSNNECYDADLSTNGDQEPEDDQENHAVDQVDHGFGYDGLPPDRRRLNRKKDEPKLVKAEITAKPAKLIEPTVTKSEKRIAWTEYPVAALPEPIQSFVREASLASQTDPSYCALACLASIAAAMGQHHRVAVKSGWEVPPTIWALLIGKSGVGKSPALRAAMKPLSDIEKELHSRFNAELAEYEDLQRQYKKWESGGRKGQPPTTKPKPIEPRLRVEDCTIESLAPIFKVSPSGLLLYRDEIKAWFTDFTGYSKAHGGNSAKWLPLFDGEPLRVDRANKDQPSTYIPSASLSIVGGIQPGIVKTIFDPIHLDSGLIARFLLTMPQPRPTKFNDDEVSKDTANRYGDLIQNLRTYQVPAKIALSAEAKSLFAVFFDENGVQVSESEGAINAALAKIQLYPIRIAGLLHAVECIHVGKMLHEVPISGEAMASAITITRWHANEAVRVYQELLQPKADEDHERLVQLILENGGAITSREFQRKKGIREEVATRMLNRLVNSGYGNWRNTAPSTQGGRPVRYFVLDDDLRDAPNADNEQQVIDGKQSAEEDANG